MYQGKRAHKKHKPFKRPLAIVAALLLLTLTIGGTLAFLTATDDEVVNTFTPSKVTTTVEEGTSNGVKSNVKIKNTGDTDAWIRAMVIVTWKNQMGGDVYGVVPQEGEDYTVTWYTSGWKKGNDGFYYYTSPVAPGASTATALIDSIQPVAEKIPEGYDLNVEIIGSGIQSKPASVFNTEWASSGLKANDDCTTIG